MTQEPLEALRDYERMLRDMRGRLIALDEQARDLLDEMERRRPMLLHVRETVADALAQWDSLPPPSERLPLMQAPRPRPGARRSRVKAAIENVLRDASEPMHANEIMSAVAAQGIPLSTKDPKATVVTALLRMSRDGLVRALGANVYEWRGDE